MSNLAEQKNNYSSSTLCGMWFEDRHHDTSEQYFPVCSNTMFLSTNKKQMMEGANSEFQQYGLSLRPENEEDEIDQEKLFSEKTWCSQTQAAHFTAHASSKGESKPSINVEEYRAKWTRGDNFNRDFSTTYEGFGSFQKQ